MAGDDERGLDRPLPDDHAEYEAADDASYPPGHGGEDNEALSYEEHLPLLTHSDDTPASPRKPTPYPRSGARVGPPPAPAGSPPAPGQASAPAPRSRSRATGKVLIALLSVIALGATGYAYATLDKLQAGVHTTNALEQDEQAPPADDGATDILLVGTDARTDMQGYPLPLDVLKALRTELKPGVNTDTIIILRLPHDGGKPSAVSIPRDSWVQTPQRGYDKINSAFGRAKIRATRATRARGMRDHAAIERESDQEGRRTLVKTVQNFTQIRIDHYAEVNLLGFYLLTEALGGIQVCLNQPTHDKDSGADFPAGPQTVSGGEALSFVRQRKNLPRGDLDRIVRQQAFLASALHQLLSAGTLTSPTMLGRLNETVHRSLVLDPDLDILKFAEQAKGIASGDVGFVTIPTGAIGDRSSDGQSIVRVDPTAVHQYMVGLVDSPATAAPAGGGGAAASSVAARGAAGESPALTRQAARTQDPITADGVVCVN